MTPNTTVERIAQLIYPVGRNRKKQVLSYLIGEGDWSQVLVFTRTKFGANKVADYLNAQGIKAMALHGNKSQSARTQALAEFKSGELRALVATDIAARGIDIDELPHVVNYEIPNVSEDYVHRIGRTGRAGAEGEASSLVCVDELKLLKDIERLIKREIPKQIVPGFEVDPSIKPEPIQNGQNRGGGQRQGQGRSQPRSGGGQSRSGGQNRSAGEGRSGNAAHAPKPAGSKPAVHRFGGRGR